MHLKKLLATSAIAFAASVSMPAFAVVMTSTSLAPGNSVLFDDSGVGRVAFDVGLGNPSRPSSFTFEIQTGDLAFGGLLSFNSVVSNLSLGGINDFKLFIDGATFSALGTAFDAFTGDFGTVSGGSSAAQIVFDPPQFFDFFIGDPVGTAGAVDWQISIAGLGVGDTFTLTMQAPAPATLSLLLASLGIAGFVRRRRNRNGA